MDGEWKKIYKEKLVTADEAVQHINSGDRLVFAFACGEPQTLVEALMKRGKELENVEIDHMIAMGPAEYCKPELAPKHFRHTSLFLGPSTRKGINEGRGDFIPIFFSQIPLLYKKNVRPVDAAFIQITPPDDRGWCSLGVCADYTIAAVENAKNRGKLVLAEVNEQMPRTFGARPIHVSELDFIVESNRPIITADRAPIGEVEEEIGRYLGELVEDGSTLQMGIGSIPEAASTFLANKKDLGIHTEMIADWLVDLVEAGAVTGKKKALHPNKIIGTFVQGTQRLYDFVNENQVLEMHPVDYTNSTEMVKQNDKVVAINSALQVDLQGQICADSLPNYLYSGVGGQIDFARGSYLSKGGKYIVAMTSTAGGGKYSRIVPELPQGGVVTATRNEVEYVVTEYGVANLRWKTLRERTEALISIAHPDFRAELKDYVKKRFPAYNI